MIALNATINETRGGVRQSATGTMIGIAIVSVIETLETTEKPLEGRGETETETSSLSGEKMATRNVRIRRRKSPQQHPLLAKR